MTFQQKLVRMRYPASSSLVWLCAFSGQGLVALFVSPVLGWASDRLGRRRLLAWTLFMEGLQFVPLALVEQEARVDAWVVMKILGGLGGSPFTIVFAMCSDMVAPGDERRLKSIIAVLLALSFGPAIATAPLIADVVFAQWSMEKVGGWSVYFILSLVNCMYTLVLPHYEEHRQLTQEEGLKLKLTNPLTYFRLFSARGPARNSAYILRRISTVLFFLYFGKMAVISLVGMFAEARFGWSPAQAGMCGVVWGFTQSVAMATLAFVDQRCQLDERTVWSIGLIGGMLGFTLQYFSLNGYILLVGNGVSAVSMVTLTALTSYAGRLVPREARGEVQGLMTTTIVLAEALTPIFALTMMHTSAVWWLANLPFLLAAASSCVALLISFTLPVVEEVANKGSSDALTLQS